MTNITHSRAKILDGLKALYAADEALVDGKITAALDALQKTQEALADARQALGEVPAKS